MAQVANPRKVFHFSIEIDGFNEFECQSLEIGEAEVEAVAHGDTNHDVYTPGRIKCGTVKLEKLRPSPGSDTWAWDWLFAAQNPETGGGSLPQDVKKTLVVRETDSTGLVILNTWQIEDCWVMKVSRTKFDRNSSDNIIETVELRPDIVKLV